MGARGAQTLDANFDKSFVTPVYPPANFDKYFVTPVYPPDPPIKAKWSNHDLVLGLCKSTQRNYPPDRP